MLIGRLKTRLKNKAMATFRTLSDLPLEIKEKIRKIQALASNERTTAEAAILTAYDVEINNEVLLRNAANEIVIAIGSATPDGYSGFAKGAIFNEYDIATGLRATYINIGTNSSAVWEKVGENTAEAVTATEGGAAISAYAKHVTVTSADANYIVSLPAPVVGKQIVINVGATGFELRSSAPATIAINGGSGANAESAIAANSTILAICISATAWKAIFLDADGDVAKVEAAA